MQYTPISDLEMNEYLKRNIIQVANIIIKNREFVKTNTLNLTQKLEMARANNRLSKQAFICAKNIVKL